MSFNNSDNEYIPDFEDLEPDNDLENLDSRETINTLEPSTDDNLENLNSRETSDITENFTDEPTTISKDNQQKGKTSSPVWEFMYKKYNDEKNLIAIVCNLCKKEYEPKTSTRPLKDYLIKEHKCNFNIKQ